MTKDVVWKVAGTAVGAVVGGGVVEVLPQTVAAIVCAGIAGFAIWKYVAVKELKRIAAQGQAAVGKIEQAIDKK